MITEYRLFVRTTDANLAHELEKLACTRGADESILQFCDEESKQSLKDSIAVLSSHARLDEVKQAKRSLTLMEL